MEIPGIKPTQWATNAPVPVGWMRQFRYMAQMFERIKNVQGDIVECGLGEGNTFAMLAYLSGSENPKYPRKLWGFDSFEGFPEPTSFDASPRNPQKGEWKVSPELVQRRLQESLIIKEFPNLNITIVPGFLDQTLHLFPDRQIAFLHLDVDLYPGYHAGLVNLFPKVVQGGLVLFDEYREFHPDMPEYGEKEKWPGCSRAVDEYFADLPYKIQHHQEAGKYFVVK